MDFELAQDIFRVIVSKPSGFITHFTINNSVACENEELTEKYHVQLRVVKNRA